MTDLYPWAPPDGLELLITHLSPLGETRDTRPSGAVLPWRMVTDLGGPATDLDSRSAYAVHTFAATRPQAHAEAMKAHRRILALNGHHPVALNGKDIYVDRVVVIEEPAERQWVSDNSIYRFVGTYQLTLRIHDIE